MIVHTIRGVCLYDLHRPLLSEVEEADGAIATTQGNKVGLMRVTVHVTQTNILARAIRVCVCVCVCVCVRERERVCVCVWYACVECICTLGVCID